MATEQEGHSMADGTDETGRNETEAERLDRNWNSLIQELRVVQTGVQFLTGFLLTLPFQNRFEGLSVAQRALYLGVVGSSIAATICLMAPVAAHRILFRRHRIENVVTTAHRYAIVGLALLGIALTGVTVLIFGTVAGPIAAAVAGTAAAVAFIAVWLVHPWHQRRGRRA